MLTPDEIQEQFMALSVQDRQNVTKKMIDALASSTSLPLDQKQAGAASAGRSDALGRTKVQRKTASFRLEAPIVKQLEDTYLQFKMAGLDIKQVDLREDIVKLGLERVDELRVRYQDTYPGP